MSRRKLKRFISLLLVALLLIPFGGITQVTDAATNEYIPVLLYHRVVDNPSNQWTDTSTETFKQTMKYLHDNGYNTLSAEQYVSIMEGKETAPAKPILLTFDDATPDFVTTALPVLKLYNMNAVLFVVSDWIGQGYSMSTEQLQSLTKEPNVSLQNHTKTHDGNIWGTNGGVRSGITKEQAEDQIIKANTFLKGMTGKDPVLMAYPYGSYNDISKKVNQENGIKYAFKVGYPDDDAYTMGRHYVTTQTVAQIAEMIGEPVPEPTPDPVDQQVTVYHETFANGLGVATPAGSAQLAAVSDKTFEGNDDGKTISVNGRTNNWDGVDILFSSVGMVNGKTYTITVKGYVDNDVAVTAGAQALFQNVNSYNGLYVAADYKAGQAFTLTGEYTVDTSKDSALRIQSNDAGKTVPFYIGDILITEKVASGDDNPGEDRPPAENFSTITFEDQTTGGFEGRAGTETLTITNEENHTTGGSYALKVEGRTQAWNGPSLRVEKYVDLGMEYKISAWVKLISPDSSQLQLSTQVGNGGTASYNNLQGRTISKADGWVKLEGTYRYTNSGGEYLTIYVESSNNATASFYIDNVSFEPTGSGPIEIEDLTPIKDVYKDDFLIGNAVSMGDLDGVRLELLNKHHNVVTAENAMKPDYAYNANREFDFADEDALVAKIKEQGLQLHGHVLVWHQQSPTWLFSDANGQPLSREAALANLRTHVKTVVEHFGPDVISWDVVNEAINDGLSNPSDWKASLRQSGWYKAVGPDFVEQSFLAAREVLDEKGWNTKLYYNDYNDDNQNKAEAIYQMVKEINEKYAAGHNGKLLIDGIGMQAHYNKNTNPDNVRKSLEKFISLGVEVSVTELDIQAGTNNVLTEQEAKAQGYLYAQLFKIYKEHADNIARVTFWGLNDATSWRAATSPLVFDKDLQAKPAYYAVVEPDQFIEENQPEQREARQGNGMFGTPTIDGTIDTVWNNAPELPVNRYQMAWQGANGVAKVLWDNENLYVLTQVSDSQLDKSSPNPWEQDSVEVFVDENNAKTSSYQIDDGQYRVNFDNETSFNPGSIADGFESANHVSENSYIVEMKIPLKTITPGNNTKIGFDVQINDGKDGSRQSAATWNDTTGTGYQDTSVFGVLTLVKPADTNKPVTIDNAPSDWLNEDVTVTLMATDNESGVKATHYKINNGAEQTGNTIILSDEGVHNITYWSEDNAGNVGSQQTTTVKIDKTAPTLNISLDKTTLWPANHQMVPVTATIAASDATSGIDSVVLTSITSNENISSDDIQNANYKVPITNSTDSFELRAVRLGNGNGRTYTITYKATDKAGNVTTKSVVICVPHDQSDTN